MTHPWKPDVDDFENVTLPTLLQYGFKIGQLSVAGDEVCQKIIADYSMLRRSFDPVTHLALRDGIAKFMAQGQGARVGDG